jgi:DNA polymerase iota
MASYYEGLSGDSSSSDDNDEEESDIDIEDADDNDNDERKSPATNKSSGASKTRCILHLDVDCFYGQCEHIDRGIPKDRPLAIGQKHIIVTSNYAARAYVWLNLRDAPAMSRDCSL